MKSTAKLPLSTVTVLLTVSVLTANVALAQPAKEIVKDFLDENVLIVVPVATNRGGVNPRLCVKTSRCSPANIHGRVSPHSG
jgi:hypothetical protein